MNGEEESKDVAEEIVVTEAPEDSDAPQADEIGGQKDEKKKGKKKKDKKAKKEKKGKKKKKKK
jgi:hypothetical protein